MLREREGEPQRMPLRTCGVYLVYCGYPCFGQGEALGARLFTDVHGESRNADEVTFPFRLLYGVFSKRSIRGKLGAGWAIAQSLHPVLR